MRRFQKGEVIRAVVDAGNGMLIKGDIYEVLALVDGWGSASLVSIRDARGIINEFYEFRFEPVKPSKKIGEFM